MDKNCFVSSLKASINNPSLPILETPESVVDRYLQVIEDTTYRNELLTFVTGLFDNGIWSKMITFYPILGAVGKMGVNLVAPDRYSFDMSLAVKDGNVLQVNNDSKASVAENDNYIINGSSKDFTVFCAQFGGNVRLLSLLNAEGSSILLNRPSLNSYQGANNLSNFVISWYDEAAHNLNLEYTGGGNSYGKAIRLIFASSEEGIVGIKNGVKRIDDNALSYFPIIFTPNYFDVAKSIYSCGTAYGMTEEEATAFDALWVAFLEATSKPFV